MKKLQDKLPSVGGPDLLPSLPDSNALEAWLLNLFSTLQKYGVLCTIMFGIMFFVFYRYAKIRKNQTFAKFWMLTSWGMGILTVFFIVAPYIILSFY